MRMLGPGLFVETFVRNTKERKILVGYNTELLWGAHLLPPLSNLLSAEATVKEKFNQQ